MNFSREAAKPQRKRGGLNSVAEEFSSSEGTEKPYKAYSFAFFASREENLPLKFAPNCGHTCFLGVLSPV
jgi:hypothetical protein